MTQQGLFITFEGGDGSGKSTQAERLATWLREQGVDVVLTREPGGTELGKAIRQLLLHGGEVSARAEALLYAADRAHHVASLVRPAVARGAIVLQDRYIESSVAYQGAGRELGAEEIRELSLWAVEGLLPDVTVLLDLSVEVGAQRVGRERDRLESAGTEFHQAVRDGYLAMAAAEPERFRVIDAEADMDAVTSAIRETLAPLLAPYLPDEAVGPGSGPDAAEERA